MEKKKMTKMVVNLNSILSIANSQTFLKIFYLGLVVTLI